MNVYVLLSSLGSCLSLQWVSLFYVFFVIDETSSLYCLSFYSMMENFLDVLLVNTVSRLPFNERVTFGLVSRRFRRISLNVMRRETKLVIKDYGHYGKGGRWVQMPDSFWDNTCLCQDDNHRILVKNVVQINDDKNKEEARLNDVSEFILNYCPNISILSLDLGRINQCTRGNPRSDRGLPRIMFKPVVKILESLLKKYQSQLVCVTLPSYSIKESVFLFPELRHLIVRSISEVGWKGLLDTSRKLESAEFESNLPAKALSTFPLGLKHLHLFISKRQDGSSDLFSAPAMKSIEVLRLEIYEEMTGGHFSIPNLRSLNMFVGHGTSATVKRNVIRSLLNSVWLSELKVNFACKDIPSSEWLRFLSVGPRRLKTLKANFAAEIIPTLVYACPLLEFVKINVTDITDDYFLSLRNLSNLKNLTVNSEKGNLSAESILSLIRGDSREKLLRLRITHYPLKTMTDETCQEIQNELILMNNQLFLKEACIIIDESRVLEVGR